MIEARSFVIGRIVESLILERVNYDQMQQLISKKCELLKCEDLTDDEWKFVLEYCKQMDQQIINMQLRRYPL